MEKSAPRYKAVLASFAICALCVGLLQTGCVVPCTSDQMCDDDLYCNGAETCVDGGCVDGTNPCDEGDDCDEDNDICEVVGCQSDADCGIGEFCDVVLNECILNENLFRVVALDLEEDGGNFEAVHLSDAHGDAANCAGCHHAEPAAGYVSCRTAGCHDDDPNEVNSYKDVAHDQNESGDGCAAAACHAADFQDNCALCHILLNDL